MNLNINVIHTTVAQINKIIYPEGIKIKSDTQGSYLNVSDELGLFIFINRLCPLITYEQKTIILQKLTQNAQVGLNQVSLQDLADDLGALNVLLSPEYVA